MRGQGTSEAGDVADGAGSDAKTVRADYDLPAALDDEDAKAVLSAALDDEDAKAVLSAALDDEDAKAVLSAAFDDHRPHAGQTHAAAEGIADSVTTVREREGPAGPDPSASGSPRRVPFATVRSTRCLSGTSPNEDPGDNLEGHPPSQCRRQR